MEKIITKTELIKYMAERSGTSVRTMTKFVNFFIECIQDLAKERIVLKLRGLFTLTYKYRVAKNSAKSNIKNKLTEDTTSGWVVSFKKTVAMKRMANIKPSDPDEIEFFNKFNDQGNSEEV